ncbi:hypothetical protein [Picosynechococcus sp. NKBG042902]|uniref:hypothetical protein n=1 Tax=Picosynechococcus sp. NKBG042902 TaxID=490193 RepID=UPI0004AB32F0|nr:hypothetical protein [Picosynechococcus sp. NKBG042902]
MSFLMQLFGALALFSLGGSLWMKSFQRKVSLALLVISVIGLAISTRSHLAFIGAIDTRSPQEIAADNKAVSNPINIGPSDRATADPSVGQVPQQAEAPTGTPTKTYEFIPGQPLEVTLEPRQTISAEGEVSITYANSKSNMIDISNGSQTYEGAPKAPVMPNDSYQAFCQNLPVGVVTLIDNSGTCRQLPFTSESVTSGTVVLNVLPSEQTLYNGQVVVNIH